MLLIVLVCSLSVAAMGQQVEDDWIDPYDMLNYDQSTKTMRKPAEPTNYNNVPTKRREHTQDPSQQTPCDQKVESLQKQIEEQEKKIKLASQQPTCTPVFRRFLSRLLKEIQRVGVPTDSTDVFYDAKIKLSRQSMTEIEMILEGEDSCRTGAVDNAVSNILVDLRPHNYEAWKWRFEDTFGVELDVVLKVGLCVLIIVAIICTELWSKASWFMQFGRLFGACFFVSIIWNWFYLYKTAFAEHQNKMAQMDDIGEKCSGLKKFDWTDNLKEFFRSTITLKDDPCKKYYEAIFVNPILLVPPTKALSVTIVTFLTEPLKHIGEGISDFLRALLKDLPVTWQIPVFLTIMLMLVVFMYGGVQAAFQYGIMAPFRRPQRDPPPPQLQQPNLQAIEDCNHLEAGDAPQQLPRPRAIGDRLNRNRVRQRRPNRPREQPAKVVVETLHTAEAPYSADETDAQQLEAEQNLSESAEANASSVDANTAQSQTKPTESDPSQPETKLPKEKETLSKDDSSRDCAEHQSQQAERQPSKTDVQDHPASAEDRTEVETVGVPVQESSPVLGE
ncbi:chloride channel CLIC-like protein 1 [Sparus aurata]|uniref:Chloride channel CLIC-like protein 1 n=1 Tax=Sparus aurata TaxID=8175 RepID=A0A671UXM8_SPAAU|nr:chloride channel CLIC-like protein 1 [Sparus aurata]